jgi:tetratricopeptide (TPR) repeat protein
MTGSFMNVSTYRMFKIIERNEGIALEIPGRGVLELRMPDEEGRYFPKLTSEISLTPSDITEGKAGKIVMHQYYRLRKTDSPDSVLAVTPEEFKEYAGNYLFAPARLSLDVRFKDGVMTTHDPLGRSRERIVYSRTGEAWEDKTGSKIVFITDGENKVTSLSYTIGLVFSRGEPVTNRVAEVINESGIDAGLRLYDEIKKSGDSYYFFSEQMLHQLGHKLQNENRLDDAIKVFARNVAEYPDSFLTNDALAEAYLKKGENKPALKYFKIAVKLNPGYDYGKEMITKLSNK